jgi:AcrR family transcriptional regulator
VHTVTRYPSSIDVGVVERLRARHEEIEEGIFARVRDLAPGPVGFADREYVAGLRMAVAAVVDYGLTGIERGEASAAAVPSAALAQAHRAARAGVGLDTVLRRYVAGYAVLGDYVMQEADHSDSQGQGAAVRHVLDTSASLLDRLIPSIAGAYTQEAERAGRSAEGRDSVPAPGSVEQGSYRMGSAVGRAGSVLSAGQAVGSHRARTSQRDRILEAMAEVVAERGFAGATVRLVTGRAGVSSRTFYECFAGLEDCFTAVMDQATKRAGILITQAFVRERSWRDGVRAALAALLVFFDSEPLLARVWLVEVLAAGSWALEHRERKIASLSSMIVEHWSVPSRERPEALAIAGVMASVLGLIHTHLVTKEPGPLIGLLGPLVGLVTTPYLDPEAVAREIQQATELSRKIQLGAPRPLLAPIGVCGAHRSVEIPALLRNPKAGRARLCIRYLAEQGAPGSSPSNHKIAAAIGVTHQGQISTLLARLHDLGLLVKHAGASGHPNAWSLTAEGKQVAQALED